VKNYNQDKIERLKQKLYRPQDNSATVHRAGFSSQANTESEAWDKIVIDPAPFRRHSKLVLTFFVSLVFFLSALGVAVYVFYRGGNIVSPNNVEILIDGVADVKAGETITLQTLITNHNSVMMKSVDLIVIYPSGTRSPTDFTQTLTRSRFPLGDIPAGGTANRTIKAVVFGEKDVPREINLTVEFRFADSNAIFDKTETHHYSISDSPITLTADWPEEVNAGQILTLAFEVVNNAPTPLKDLAIRADFPSGFIFQSAVPTSIGGNFWRLGDLPSGGKRRLMITGMVDGQDEDLKSFHFSTGTPKPGSAGELDLVYGELFRALAVKRPSVGLALVLNGKPAGSEQAISSGELLRADITWVNNLSTEVLDGRFEVKINGAALDKRSVTATDGFWQSADNLIVWNKSTKPGLARLDAGASGQISFTFSTIALADNRGSGLSLENPSLNLEVRFSGRRIATGGSDQPIETKVASQIKINSVFQLAAEASYHDGPFANVGPLPPKVDQETTYTVAWSVINSSNSVRDAIVKATLPTYVRWMNVVSPLNEKVTFNELTGEVIWDLGTVEARRGLTTAARQAFFQIVFRPSLGQVDQTPVILTTSVLTGLDTFTNEKLTYSRRPLDTRLLNDQQFRVGDERVVN